MGQRFHGSGPHATQSAMFLGLALVAGVVEAGAGYPDIVYRAIGHPVTWMGRLIAWADERWNSEQDSPVQQRSQGIALVVALLAISLFAGLLISKFFHSFLPSFIAVVPIAILASSLLAQRSLHDHVDAVAAALDQSLDRGRQAVSMIVGRDTRELNESGVCRAAIESLAESFSDGIVAPMFWLAITGLSGGIAYKAINTADSMIGHKTEKIHRLRLGSGAHRRRPELAARAPVGVVAGAGGGGGAGHFAVAGVDRGAARRAPARLAQCGLAGSGDGRRARRAADGPAHL